MELLSLGAMMKILWVKPGGIVPLDSGGKIRSYHLLHELAKSHDVTFFSFYAAHRGDCHRDLEKVFSKVILCPLQLLAAANPRNWYDYLRAFAAGQPASTARFCVREVFEALRKTIAQTSFDAIICDFLMGAMVIPPDWPGPKVFFAHNVEALIWKRHSKISNNPIWKLFTWLEYCAMARTEERSLRESDHVLAVSTTDRDYFLNIVPPEKITVIPTGVDTEYFRPLATKRQPHSMVFTGSMDWMPNEDAISYFVGEIFPHIRRELPEATLWVVGRKPTKRLQSLVEKIDGIRVTGAVEDIRPFVAQAEVYVVPLRVGSGTRIKIFEAMAMGMPVVSTTIGAEGLPVEDGKNICLTDDPREFARRILDLFANGGRRKLLGEAARNLVEEKYSWASVAKVLENILQQLTAKSS